MVVPDYPSNSKRPREPREAREPREKAEPKKIHRVVTGEVKRRKTPLGKRLFETFIGGDAQSVWGHVAFDILIPGAKNMFADAMYQGVERMMFGEARSGRSRRPSYHSDRNDGYTSYNHYSVGGKRKEEPRHEMSRRSRSRHNFDDVILPTRHEANEVINELAALTHKYDSVTVSDLYEILGLSSNFADENWGWTDMENAGISRSGNGFLLNLPRPEPLD